MKVIVGYLQITWNILQDKKLSQNVYKLLKDLGQSLNAVDTQKAKNDNFVTAV